MLRTIAALVLDMAAKRLPHSSLHPEQWELPELMDALQKTFQQTYDAQVGSVSPTGTVNGFIRDPSLKVCANNGYPTTLRGVISLFDWE